MQTAAAREVSFVVHDLKNPLTAIRLQAELALRQMEGSRAASTARNLEAILRAVEWMNNLVHDLLDDPTPADHVEFSVSEYVLVCVEQVRTLAEERHVTFDISIAPDLPPVFAPRCHALPVLLNILGNAIEHGPVGGVIHISAVAQGGHVVFAVRDEGVGIPRNVAARVFEEGVRGSQSAGHGLGLAIAAARVNNLGGRIWVEPAIPHGALFHFTLPSASSDQVR